MNENQQVYYLYIIFLPEYRAIYVGQTNNLRARLMAHRGRLGGFRLWLCERYPTREMAKAHEQKKIKELSEKGIPLLNLNHNNYQLEVELPVSRAPRRIGPSEPSVTTIRTMALGVKTPRRAILKAMSRLYDDPTLSEVSIVR
jgi:hypothetical protein